eukprot:TRINITY_DN34800_c0_g1_i1.p1 TRINITY_DN34800_c0_g1~~TRINITY_DN34800_c0_g1_i1.p1  ORF type:complete len:674 (-),score=104.06 TRINITY_DN34800_c0_g1_i1:215-2236(-)
MAASVEERIDALAERLQLECTDFLPRIDLCSQPSWDALHFPAPHYRSLVGLFGVFKHPDLLAFSLSHLLGYVCFPILFLWWSGICVKLARNSVNVKNGSSLRNCVVSFKAFFQSVTASGYFQAIEEPLRSEMIEVVGRQRRDLFLRLTRAASVILPMVCLWVLIQNEPWTFLASCRDDPNACTMRNLRGQQVLLAECLGTTLFLAMCMFATTFPGCVGAVFMASTHASLIFGIAWHRIDAISYSGLEMHSNFFVHLRLAAGVCSGSIPETVVLNSLLFCLEVVLADDIQPYDFHLHIRKCAMYCLFIFACTVSKEQSRMQQVKLLVTGHASWRRAHTAKDILNMMCDAVVELCNFTVSQPCPKLETLTLRVSSAHLKGTPFLELVCDADRERCQAALTSKVDSTRTVHVDLRESLGGRVRVQLFITSVPTLSGNREHVIGIREENDGANDQVSGVLPSGIDRPRRQAPPCSPSEYPIPRSSSSDVAAEPEVDIDQSSCASVFDYLKASPSAYQNNALLWLTKDDTLTISGYSLPFLHYFGPSFSALAKNFREWVAPECSEAFAEWLDDHLTENVEPGHKFRRLRLYPPHLCKSVKILCEVQFLPVEEEDPEWAFVFDDASEDEDFKVPTVLVIDKVTYKWNRARACERVLMPSRGLNNIEVRSEGNTEDLLQL